MLFRSFVAEYGGVGGYGAGGTAPQGTTAQQKKDDPVAQQQALDRSQIQKSTNQLAPQLSSTGAAPLNKVKFQDVMNKLNTAPDKQLNAQDAQQLTQLGAEFAKTMTNPQTISQAKQLINKTQQLDTAKQAKLKQAQGQTVSTQPAAQTQPQSAGKTS